MLDLVVVGPLPPSLTSRKSCFAPATSISIATWWPGVFFEMTLLSNFFGAAVAEFEVARRISDRAEQKTFMADSEQDAMAPEAHKAHLVARSDGLMRPLPSDFSECPLPQPQ